MSEVEETYSTAQIASLLNLTRAMVNKYALAVEEFSGKKVPQTAKDGRKFSTEDYQVIANAKFLVDSERVTLNTAVKMSLGQAELVPTAPGQSLEGIDTARALEAIVRDNREGIEAIVRANQANNELLLKELRRLQGKELPASEVDTRQDKPGTFTKIGQWIDKRLRGF